MDFQDKIVIVTGGANGIGAAVVREFSKQGAFVAFLDNDRQAAAGLLNSPQYCDKNTLYLDVDLLDAHQCMSAVKSVIEAKGRIDILVNNAGINDGVGLDQTPDEFRRSLERNLVHYFAMTHFSLPYLVKNHGVIVNISSKVALTGQGATSGYAAAKGAILALTREWAAELCSKGVRVNCVVPAEVDTPQYRRWLERQPDPEEQLRKLCAKVPFENRLTKPEEIADFVVFLASEKSRHVTGQHIVVDGGYTHLDRALT